MRKNFSLISIGIWKSLLDMSLRVSNSLYLAMFLANFQLTYGDMFYNTLNTTQGNWRCITGKEEWSMRLYTISFLPEVQSGAFILLTKTYVNTTNFPDTL